MKRLHTRLVAERHPKLVKAIATVGHEVASHGWDHGVVTELTRPEFGKQVRCSKAIIEDFVGETVLGYRAPSFSLVRGKEWALDILNTGLNRTLNRLDRLLTEFSFGPISRSPMVMNGKAAGRQGRSMSQAVVVCPDTGGRY